MYLSDIAIAMFLTGNEEFLLLLKFSSRKDSLGFGRWEMDGIGEGEAFRNMAVLQMHT